jgi:hypothetical protein
MTRRVLIAVLVPLALVLSGCVVQGSPHPVTSPGPSRAGVVTRGPSPTATIAPKDAQPVAGTEPPPISELVLTPDGLGTLSIGALIDPLMATFDPEGCRTPNNEGFYPDGDPHWAAYLPNYAPVSSHRDGLTYTQYPFEPHHNEDGTLRWLRIRSSEIATDRAVSIGSSEEEVLAAYPDAVVFKKWDTYRSYNIDGETGRLVIEVTGRDFDASAPPEVWAMYLTPATGPLYSIGGSDGGEFCVFGA